MLRLLAKSLGSKSPEEKASGDLGPGTLIFYLKRIFAPAIKELQDAVLGFAQELRSGRVDLGPDTATATCTRVSLRTGIGVPPATLGNNGDLYWDSAGLGPPTIYLKSGGAWMVVV